MDSPLFLETFQVVVQTSAFKSSEAKMYPIIPLIFWSSFREIMKLIFSPFSCWKLKKSLLIAKIWSFFHSRSSYFMISSTSFILAMLNSFFLDCSIIFIIFSILQKVVQMLCRESQIKHKTRGIKI